MDHAEYAANIILEAEARARGFDVLRTFEDLDSRTFRPALTLRMAFAMHFISLGLIVSAASLAALAQLRMTIMKTNLNRLMVHASDEQPVEKLFCGWGTSRTLAIVSWTILLSVLISYVGLLIRTAALDTSAFVVACIVLLGACVLLLPSLLILRATQAKLLRLRQRYPSAHPFSV